MLSLYLLQIPDQLQDVSDVAKDIVQHGLQNDNMAFVLLGVLVMLFVSMGAANFLMMRNSNKRYTALQNNFNKLTDLEREISVLRVEAVKSISAEVNDAISSHDQRMTDAINGLEKSILGKVINILSKQNNDES